MSRENSRHIIVVTRIVKQFSRLPLGEQNFLVRSKITGGNFHSWHASCFISSVRTKTGKNKLQTIPDQTQEGDFYERTFTF